jgi:hypothetical protein
LITETGYILWDASVFTLPYCCPILMGKRQMQQESIIDSH